MTVQWRGPTWLRRPLEKLGVDQYYNRITRLSLHGPKYDDRFVEDLARLEHLESLVLSDTKVSPQGIAQLRQALPRCTINGMPPRQRA